LDSALPEQWSYVFRAHIIINSMESPLSYVSVKKGKMSIPEHKIKEIVSGSFKDLEQFVDNFDGKIPVFDYPKFSYEE
jgi:hypothetical protein